MPDPTQEPQPVVIPTGVRNVTTAVNQAAPPSEVERQNAPQGNDQPAEKEVEDASVIFVPQEDFTGRINGQDFDFRKDVPTKCKKAEANIWLEAEKGYIK